MALEDIIEEHKHEQKYYQCSFLNTPENAFKVGVSPERIEAIKPLLRQYIAYWREYPDMFIDFLVQDRDGNIPNGGFKFYGYQRVFLRIIMRYKYVYATYPRASMAPKLFLK